ncbi:hypothetical protein NKR23_g1354 [Pleurostoma richardsiae]|uniref:Uncharacterized protein n=1 Tax=Pleurostoma richardsiae TaxID=41990 RepID=A0AA38SAP1_9PEZI|nr:hypothetical protein NKR23_g1354 [Pleurostoma richardsiae]
MASCSAGSYAGSAKNTRLGLVRLRTNTLEYSRISSTMYASDTIVAHFQTVNSCGRAVVAMSFAATAQYLWWPRPEHQPKTSPFSDAVDVFKLKLQDAYDARIATVASAGNYTSRPAL